jgi:hypothetical protein
MMFLLIDNNPATTVPAIAAHDPERSCLDRLALQRFEANKQTLNFIRQHK